MTNTFLLVILLLEVRVLHSLVLPIKLCFTIKLALVLKLVGLEVFLLYQIGTRTSLNTSSTVVLCSRLSSTSRVPMRSGTENSCLLCFSEVAKFLHVGGILVMIPPAINLSGRIQLKCSSSLANDYIS